MEGEAAADGVRLQKVLAVRGFGSRRIVEDMIEDGRVSVNGQVAVLGRRVDVESDAVEVDGVRVGVAPDLIYYLLNKPKGVVTTAADTHDREIVTELVPDEPRVYPVGRLDLDTEGLLLITNDGDLTHRLTHPSFGIEKEYLVEVDKPVSRGDLRRLREGVELDDGMTAPAKAQQVAPSVIKLTIHEGRNRQIRRMCSALGFTVTRLVRIRIGALADRNMAPGEWRELTLDEIRRLEELTALAGREAR
ncbi:MAG: pseudouridine synthase [Acidimicrobiales bacterium]|jgi:23S rRNA pseudouridine2605 synthase